MVYLRSDNPFWQEITRKAREPVDHEKLMRLRPLEQTAELLSLGYTTTEIADIRGLASRACANAQLQRIRGQIGWQAV